VGETDIVERVRAICLALPEVTEKLSHGSPAFFAPKQFVMLWPDGHHGNHFPHLWCAAPSGAQGDHISREPERFFRPPYVDWTELEDIIEDAYRVIAPNRLIAMLDESPPD
jgi:hypothetical protein